MNVGKRGVLQEAPLRGATRPRSLPRRASQNGDNYSPNFGVTVKSDYKDSPETSPVTFSWHDIALKNYNYRTGGVSLLKTDYRDDILIFTVEKEIKQGENLKNKTKQSSDPHRRLHFPVSTHDREQAVSCFCLLLLMS